MCACIISRFRHLKHGQMHKLVFAQNPCIDEFLGTLYCNIRPKRFVYILSPQVELWKEIVTWEVERDSPLYKTVEYMYLQWLVPITFVYHQIHNRLGGVARGMQRSDRVAGRERDHLHSRVCAHVIEKSGQRHMYTHSSHLFSQTCTCIHTIPGYQYMIVHAYVHVHVDCTYMYVCMYVCMYVRMYVCIVCVCVCVCVYVQSKCIG